jgi:hypothetical protein
MIQCSKPGCNKPAKARGMCRNHYGYYRNRGDYATKECSVEGCDRGATTKGLCSTHYVRKSRGTPMGPPIRKMAPKGAGYVDDMGYRRVGKRAEHRLVMEGILGRSLLPSENVHHLNGDRTDNRPENLELWLNHQPKGQRVSDQVEWAIQILLRYAPERLKKLHGVS